MFLFAKITYVLISLNGHDIGGTGGTYQSHAQCTAAIRQIYSSRIDPYNSLPPEIQKAVLDNKMKYSAPKQYVCAPTR